MLLSLFLSFLLARKFGSRIYILSVTILIIVIPLFSVGLPLSFPFYAFIWAGISAPEACIYGLYFLTFEINRSVTTSYFFHRMFFIYYSFFLLVNVVGAILGYWISKSKTLREILKDKGLNNP